MTKTANTDEIKIRRIKRNEFAQVFELISNAFQREIEITGLDIRRLRRNAILYNFFSGFTPILDMLHIDFETLLVAVSREKVVGQIHLIPYGKNLWGIASAAVDAEYRGRGIYKNLMIEASRYIAERHGKRIVQSIVIDNAPVVKVAKELEFEVFEEETRLLLEIKKMSPLSLPTGISIRSIKPTDVEQIHEICKAVCPKRIEALRVVPSDFSQSMWNRLRNSLIGTHLKSWVLEAEGKILGYASVTYTSQEEAANIEYFCVFPSKNRPEQASMLLSHVINFLGNRSITKIILNLNVEWKDLLGMAQHLGLKPFLAVFHVKKEIV